MSKTQAAEPKWITGPVPETPADYTALYLRGSHTLTGQVRHARARVSALGWYRFFVNGTDQTGAALVPRWTPFDQYIEYQDYDITEALREARNTFAMAVGDGRFRGRIGGSSRQAVYGDRLAGYVTIDIEYTDGSRGTYVSDETWWAGTGRISTTDPMHGEHVDLRIPQDDWLTAMNAPGRFTAAQVLDTERTLIAEEVARVQQIDTLKPVTITRTPGGKQLFDFGQNAVGVVRLRLNGPAGTVVRLTQSEIIAGDGEVDVKYLAIPPLVKPWSQADQVILDGTETWWQPWFTIHGFRYVQIEGLPGTLTADDVQFVVLSTQLEETGSFACSDARLNKLYENVRWSMRSNFTDTPTDCPTRERSGWTGDIQVFASASTAYANVAGFLRRYLRNLAAEQLPDGRIPVVIPAESSEFSGGLSKFFTMLSSSTGWGDASVQLPWVLYQYYGDTEALEMAYPAAARWVDQMINRAAQKSSIRRRGRLGTGKPDLEKYILDTGFNWGEWLRPGETFLSSALDSNFRSGPIIATAYLEHSSRQLAEIAALLHRDGDAARYRGQAEKTREAWRAAFLRQDGRIGTDRQDDYVRAIAFDLLNDNEKPAAVTRLVELIEKADNHLATGFLSTPMLLPVLADNGRADVAARLLMQTTSPSWLYQVEQGGTSTWETWEGYTKKGDAKASHNHYAVGSVAGFLVERLAGIAPAEPGYKVIDIRPILLEGINHANATVGTPFGPAAVSWRNEGNHLHISATIPDGATGRLRFGNHDEILPPGTTTREVPIHSTAGSMAA
ncbi:family 78 glycoside hydrolase catalytic domain [Paenarthrobacter sp. NPDC057981]|uniref:alpha-L-rhamnosidase n=1 Tax=Paenarthrobacter sp. NPDC057981 TaxID=3346297 RepID=UPI0036DD6C14